MSRADRAPVSFGGSTSLMTCRDYQALWNSCLDEPGILTSSLGDVFAAHEADCPPCRRIGFTYRMLMKRLPAPNSPSGLADRIVSAWEGRRHGVRIFPAPRTWRRPVGLVISCAAAVLLAVVLRGWAVPSPKRLLPLERTAVRSWDVALASTASATLDLARETSAPVARIGQDVFHAAGLKAQMPPLQAGSSDSSETMVGAVSRRVNAEIRPLGGTARRAFSFLITPKPPDRRPSSRDSGA